MSEIVATTSAASTHYLPLFSSVLSSTNGFYVTENWYNLLNAHLAFVQFACNERVCITVVFSLRNHTNKCSPCLEDSFGRL